MNVNFTKFGKKEIGIAIATMLVAMLAMVGGVSAQTADTGDIEVTVENNGTSVSDSNVTLYDASDDTEVETLKTDADGVVTYTSVAHGDYYLSYTDGSNVTTDTATFNHQYDTSVISWDVDANSVTLEDGSGNIIMEVIGDEEDFVVQTPSLENVDNFYQNPSILAGAGLFVGGVAFVAFILFILFIFKFSSMFG